MQDSAPLACDCASSWRPHQRPAADASTQDALAQFVDAAVASEPSVSVGVETEAAAPGAEEAKADAAVLAQFLRGAAPMVERELRRNLASAVAFGEHARSMQEEGVEAAVVAQLRWAPPAAGTAGSHAAASLSSLGFNANGSLLGVGCGEESHAGWCMHGGALRVFNVLASRLADEPPLAVFECPSCVMSVAWHPEALGVVAVGLFSGEIRVFDVEALDRGDADEPPEPLLAASSVEDCFHREPVTRLAWVRSRLERVAASEARAGIFAFQLVSVAADGRVLFWTLRNRLQQPEHGAVLTAGDASGARRGGAARGRVLGGTALSFSLDCATYVVGTEGGALLKCVRGDGAAAAARRRGGGLGGGEPTVREGDFEWSLEAHALLQGAEAAHQPELRRQVEKHARLQGAKVVQLAHVFGARPDPVKLFPSSAKLAFAPHRGPVYGLQFSPFHRGVFLAASTDGTLSLFSLLAQAPALVIDLARPLLDVAWSPARPLVFAASDWAGSVHVFDLSASTSTPALTLQHPRRVAAQAAAASDALAVNAVAFASGGALLASCDEAGCACLWRLSPRLVEQQPGEVAELARLASASHADDAAVPA